jgi:hypothetical protein
LRALVDATLIEDLFWVVRLGASPSQSARAKQLYRAQAGAWRACTRDPEKKPNPLRERRQGHGRGHRRHRGRGAKAADSLSRDLIVALIAGEETGGFAGVAWLVEHHPELLDAELG